MNARPMMMLGALGWAAAGAMAGDTLYAWDAGAGGGDALLSVRAGLPSVQGVGAGGVPGIGPASEIEFAEGLIYATDTSDNSVLRVIDPGTGELVGTLSLTFPASPSFLNVVTAMEYLDGVMYAGMSVVGGGFDAYLCTIDLGTGQMTLIDQLFIGSALTGLAGEGDTLYGTTGLGAFSRLYLFDTLGVTLFGPDLTLGGAQAPKMTALEFSPEGHLYALSDPSGLLAGHVLLIDRVSGDVHDLGDTGAPGLVALTLGSGDDTPQQPGCSVADLAEPYGQTDFSDVAAFLTAFGAGCP